MPFHPGQIKQSSERVSTQQQLAFALLHPGHHPPRANLLRPLNDLSFLEKCNSNTITALDLETTGIDAADASQHVVGIGLANEHGSAYYTIENYRAVFQLLWQNQTPLIAHNLFFDASWIMRDYPQQDLNWLGCTYAWYKLTATEGWPGQEWGLKRAQKQLLRWTETNEKELDLWLVRNGYVGSTSLTNIPGTVEFINASGETRWGRPSKGEMHRAPAEILGHYCALDAEATWLLYTHILAPVIQSFPGLAEYAGPRYTKYILLLVQQKLRGILIDRARMEAHQTTLKALITQAEQDFLALPEVSPHVAVYNQAQVEEHLLLEPPKWKAKKKMGTEPHQFNKKGEVTGAWSRWNTRKEELDAELPEVTVRWQNWEAKREQLATAQHFNLNSGPQKQWLFYTQMEYPIVFTTDSGLPATDDKSLRAFGAAGKLLNHYNECVKELSYVEQLLGMLKPGNTLHAGWRIPGTLTGRLAGKDPNIQQMPKSKGFLEAFIARPGYVIIDTDHSALEQVVLTELSQDPNLWKIYGPNAASNDIYLFTGANLPGIGKAIRAAGYDPDNPTPEGIASAKKLAKKERGIAKVVVLSSSYGAGPGKIAQTLSVEGIILSSEEAVAIHRGYWDLYSGVKKFERTLLREYNRNRGWILNGIGRPIGIAADYTKDIVSRDVQGCGHDLHVLYIGIVAELLDKAGIEWHPWIVDLHDAMAIEVPIAQQEKAKQIMNTIAYAELHRMVGGKIALRGDSVVCSNWSESKCE